MLKPLIHKYFKSQSSLTKGFTLLELLVSIVIASIIVGTLLTFLFNILERDRIEQAKVEAQEETQAALNFIANDLIEASYIYDADGLYTPGTDGLTVASQLPHVQNAGNNTCSTGGTTNCTPVLVFWKRFRYDSSGPPYQTVRGGNSGTPNRQVRCLEGSQDTSSLPSPPNCITGDKFVHSLVVYYHVKKDNHDIWSNSSRIVRWEIRDGIPWACQNPSVQASCPTAANQRAAQGNTGTIYATLAACNAADTNCAEYAVLPDPGFRRFDLSGTGTLSERMRRWRKGALPYDLGRNPYNELIDYIDDTPYVTTHDDGVIGNSPANSRIDINIIANTPGNLAAVPPVPSSNLTCDDPDIGVGVGLRTAQLGTAAQTVFAQRIPPNFGNATFNPTGLSSFYACVNANRVSARVYIRSNALARIQSTPSFRPVTDGAFEGFIPTANVRAFGRGFLSVD